MTSKSQQNLTARAMTSRVKGRPPSTLDVDWTILVERNPPPGFRPTNRATLTETAEKEFADADRPFNGKQIDGSDDRVCAILRNILRQLEKDIQNEKNRLKEKRRDRRRVIAENRDARKLVTEEMSRDVNNSRRQFRASSPGSGFYNSLTDNKMRKRIHDLDDLKRSESFKLSNLKTRSLDRRFTKSFNVSSLGEDWSRYSRVSDDLEDSKDLSDSWNDQSVSFDSSKCDTDSDSTIENGNSDSENMLEDNEYVQNRNNFKHIPSISNAFSEIDNVNTSTPVLPRNNNKLTMSSTIGQQCRTSSETSGIKVRKQLPDINMLPTLKQNMSGEFVDEVRSKFDRPARFCLNNRSNSVDVCLGLHEIGQNKFRSDETYISDKELSPLSSPSTISFGNSPPIKFGKARAAPIPKPPRKRSLDQRRNLVRQKPVNNVESFLLSDVGIPNIDMSRKKSSHGEVLIEHGVTSVYGVTSVNDVTSRNNIKRSHDQSVSDSPPSISAGERRLHTFAGLETERSQSTLSTGTSGYSTDEHSLKTSDSDDDTADLWPRVDAQVQGTIHKYFLVLKNGTGMALTVDNSGLPGQDMVTQSSVPLKKHFSMSDLAIPDQLGWLTDVSDQRKVWGVVVDMLFCVFEDQDSSKPLEAILLPGCNVRPLVYNSAINGIHPNQSTNTISGLAKFQLVIDNASTRKKYLFGLESQAELDSWYQILKKASVLDPDVTNDISTNGHRASPTPNRKRLSLDGEVSKIGYMPTQGSPNRVQKLARPRSPVTSSRGALQPEVNGHSDGHPSPRGLVRHDSKRQSVQDFKKMLRRDTEPELSKQQPVKAQHFTKNTQEGKKDPMGKKLSSFGSIESLLKFKRRRNKRDSECDSMSNDDTGSVVSSSSFEQEMMTKSLDISAPSSKLKKHKTKQMSRSLDSSQPKTKSSNGIVRRASDIKDRVFSRRSSKIMTKLGELKDLSVSGFLHHKHHLKWQRLWCCVCRGYFYGFKSQSAEETASLAVTLAHATVTYVAEKDKRQKRIYIFKLSQENKRSIYLCCSDYKELLQWLTILQMESNTVISNVHKLLPSAESETDSFSSSLSSQNGSTSTNGDTKTDVEPESRSRSKKKKAPPKPPRHSSCPPPLSRDPITSEGGSLSSGGEDTGTSGTVSSSQSEEVSSHASSDDAPRHDKALTYVWQNDRGYLFNVIRAKLSSYKRRPDETIYNKELPGADNQGLLMVQDNGKKGTRPIRKSRSFSTSLNNMNEAEDQSQPSLSSPLSPSSPSDSPASLRKRHKPLVVKRISAKDLESKQTLAGYMERKGLSAQWQRYWYILHEGTLFCYLTQEDTVTVDILNLRGYSVSGLIDKFRGKRFVLQLAHENFTSLHLSMDSREEMDMWNEALAKALKRPCSTFKEEGEEDDKSACAGCENNRREDLTERSKLVKQKLLEEMLRQKRELERKQAERQKRNRSKDQKELESPDSPFGPPNPDFLSDEQRTSDKTRLRQRRLSTQLKVDTIQKQIVKPNQGKRGLFGFGKSKKLDENKNEFLQDQLKELNTRLHKIDSDLNLVEHDKVHENFDVNQNRKSMGGYPDIGLIERHENNDEKGNGLKEKMQKWTNKTFSKASTKRKQGSNELRLSLNGSVPNLAPNQNGDLNGTGNGYYGTDNDSEIDSYADENGSLENSVTDLTRPPTDFRLDFKGSPSSARYSRTNSRGSTGSTLSSPRREIDPTVMAEIDAFEELTKQVLGARTKEQPAK